jgi:hypothetical protein
MNWGQAGGSVLPAELTVNRGIPPLRFPFPSGTGSYGRNDKDLRLGKGRERLAQIATAPARVAQASKVAELARFFPEATPVRIPVECTRVDGARQGAGHGTQSKSAIGQDSVLPPSALQIQESTVIEFGTSREVLFACSMAVEFGDWLRLRNCDRSLDTEVEVVAVQYHPENTIVAARFVKEVPNWIVKS